MITSDYLHHFFELELSNILVLQVAETLIKKVLAPPTQKTKLIQAEEVCMIHIDNSIIQPLSTLINLMVPVLQHEVDGKIYYTFEFVAQAPNYTRHALSTISIGNGKQLLHTDYYCIVLGDVGRIGFNRNFAGKFYTLTTGANERRWGKMKDKLQQVIESFKIFTVFET